VEQVLVVHLEDQLLHDQELMVIIQLFQQLLQQEEEVEQEKVDQDLIVDLMVVLVEDLVIVVQVEQEIHPL
tara:strand:+ start:176 stop:388 length:213 start_codon:yes stop_codon:yes gene_type:complete